MNWLILLNIPLVFKRRIKGIINLYLQILLLLIKGVKIWGKDVSFP